MHYTHLLLLIFANIVLESLSKPQKSLQSCCHCDSRGKTKGSIVLTLYLHLIDQVGELLQSYDYDYDMMMEQCRSLRGSDHADIKLFTSDHLQDFSQYKCHIIEDALFIYLE